MFTSPITNDHHTLNNNIIIHPFSRGSDNILCNQQKPVVREAYKWGYFPFSLIPKALAFTNFDNQSVRLHNAATPYNTQVSGGTSVGNSIATTKLVDIPVVERTPFLSDVLYTGQA